VIVVVDRGVRHQAVQAFAFGANDVISRPVERSVLLERLLSSAEFPAGLSSAITSEHQDPVLVGVDALQDAFKAVCAGGPVDLRSIDAAGQVIMSHIKVDGLAYWIDAVRRYHGQTYQHCLLVTGVAASFGQKLGFCETDQRKLTFAALLHDVGKARIPIAILEKPSALDRDEIVAMKLHPLLGLEILQKARGVAPAVLDVVVHHHEYLDGSGYPHGLGASTIPDLVRIITIADVFGALIERRCYKPPLSSEAAYEILTGMGPKLDRDLVREFRNLVEEQSR
jgi:putative nucleotidyltransferase with HDIG domain